MEAPLTPEEQLEAERAQRRVRMKRRKALGGSAHTPKKLAMTINGPGDLYHEIRDHLETLGANDTVIVLRIHPAEQEYLNRYCCFSCKLSTGHRTDGDTFMLLPGDYVLTDKQNKYLRQLEGTAQRVKVSELAALQLT